MSVYLNLFHGRTDPDQDMEDWGTEGPTLGPLNYVHLTYMSSVRIGCDAEVASRFFKGENEPWLEQREDMILYDGVYYGDFSISSDSKDHELS